jgi:prophage maintenance system killer protein
MDYPTPDTCRQLLFPYIRSRLVSDEPAPIYDDEQVGLRRLEGILGLMQRDDYKGVLGKAAYLFCSIIDGHPFSNGNKRLAVTLLLYTLLSNGWLVNAPNLVVMRSELVRIFPNLLWEEVQTFRYPHEFFFYHLALIIADRKQKGHMTFHQEQMAVRELLGVVMMEPEEAMAA